MAHQLGPKPARVRGSELAYRVQRELADFMSTDGELFYIK